MFSDMFMRLNVGCFCLHFQLNLFKVSLGKTWFMPYISIFSHMKWHDLWAVSVFIFMSSW